MESSRPEVDGAECVSGSTFLSISYSMGDKHK